MQIEVAERLTHGWWQNIDIGDEYESYQTLFINTFLKIHHVWACRLGRNITTKHQIELFEPSRRPVDTVHYRAGPKIPKFEKTEVGESINENIIKPSKTKRVSPTVFAPKKTALFESVSTAKNLTPTLHEIHT